MTPALWKRNPNDVATGFAGRHPADVLPGLFVWAVWTAGGSDFLIQVDDRYGGAVVPGSHHPDLVDISHVRWATGNAITAVDLCAATLGRPFCGNIGGRRVQLAALRPSAGHSVPQLCAASSQPSPTRLPHLGRRHPCRPALPSPPQCTKPLHALMADTPPSSPHW